MSQTRTTATQRSASGACGMNAKRWLPLLALGLAVSGCDSGPGESEIVSACLQEGARGANKALRREMGIKSETFCRCAASVAKSQLSAEGRRFMVLDMQGKTQEARSIASKMSEPEQAALMQGAVKVVEKCAMAQ